MRRAGLALILVILTSCAGPARAESTPRPGQTFGEITVSFVRPGATPAPVATIPVGTEVRILGSTFDPQILQVPLGASVTWTSRDAILHTVTSGTFGAPTGVFDRELSTGAAFSYTFTQAGSFAYYCRLHGGMQAQLIVK